MRRLPIIFLPVLLLSFLCGCKQVLHNIPVFQDKGPGLHETGAPVYTEPAEKFNGTDQKPARSCLAVAGGEDPCLVEKAQLVLDEALDFCRLAQDFWQKGELEKALCALDQAYSLILKVDARNDLKLIRQREDLRFIIARRILEIYASRNIVVSGNYSAIPLVINKYVQAEIDRFTKRERRFFIESYKRSGRYRPYIVSALREAGLPVELSWLPLVESGFKADALSPARALGIWQFIPSTGHKFGLTRDTYIDERMDPFKSTTAAVAYLKELHRIFGDWMTVLAAYNAGTGRVLRVIRNQNINYLDNFWDLYRQLPRETATYVPRFLAAVHIVNNLEKYGFDSINVDPPLKYETVIVSRQVHLKDVAKKIGVPERTLKGLNPELRHRILPRDKYSLKVPPGSGDTLLSKIDEIPVFPSPRQAFVYHRVRPGETLSAIASQYRTSVRRIALANGIHRHDFIVAGKKLKIPQSGVVVYRAKESRKTGYRQASAHVVKRGDSLWTIARRYGTTTKKLQKLNSLSGTNLYVGQVLNIPGRSSDRAAGGNLRTYLVEHGDSPYKIARRHNMPLKRFLHINRLTNVCKIYPGQKLYVEQL